MERRTYSIRTIIVLSISVLLGVGLSVFGQGNQSEFMSRYEFTEALQESTCEPCIQPTAVMLDVYTEQWLDERRQKIGTNIDDIYYNDTYFEGNNYYYCVASVVDKGIMHGFPRETSPYCRGQFCGQSTMTFSELVTAVYRTMGGVIYSRYSAPWQEIRTWSQENKQSIPIQVQQSIISAYSACQQELCVLRNPAELEAYMMRCSENLGRCNFQVFDNFGAGNVVTTYLNILLKYDLLSIQDINKFTMYQEVPRSFILALLDKSSDITSCSVATDYDFDGILNQRDNCIYIYNPNQKNQDKDAKGDVCDNDIDNDGIKNEPGVIDDRGVINPRLRDASEDNCVIVPNTQQEDANGDGKGDACEGGTVFGLQIDATPIQGTAPLFVQFEGIVGGTLEGSNVTWDFGDMTAGQGLTPSHIYQNPGKYTVRARAQGTDGSVAQASIQIIATTNPSQKIGYQIFGDALYHENAPSNSTMTHEYVGEIQRVTRQRGTDVTDVLPGEGVLLGFPKKGLYFAESQAYNNNGQWVGFAQASIEVTQNEPGGSQLNASILTPAIGEPVTLTTTYEGFDDDDVSYIERVFGDGTEIESPESEVQKVYEDPGAVIVTQRIVFKDRTRDAHENALTLFIIEPENDPSSYIEANPLIVSVNQQTVVSLELINLSVSNIETIEWTGDDGFSTDQNVTLSIPWIYTQPGHKLVTATIYTKDNIILYNELTVGVVDAGSCSTGGEWACDMDDDGYPDICDDDIDGDGIPNRVGILIGENDDCSIDESIIDGPLFDDFQDWIEAGGQGDNCFINPNEEQEDEDNDGIGDACDDSYDGPPPEGEDYPGTCSDGIDNDGDGYIDCSDGDCSESEGCIVDGGNEGEDYPETCSDGIDNDGDGYVDCSDGDCSNTEGCEDGGNGPGEGPDEGPETCSDGIDNDGDGYTDCSDGDCSGSPECIVDPGDPAGGNTAGGDPSGGDPSGGDPSGGDPSGGDPSGGDPSGGDPSGGDPSGGDPSGGDPSGGDPSGGDPSGGDPSGGDPSGGDPSGGDPSGGDPSGGDPSGGDPSGGDPSGGDPSGGDPSGGDPSGGDPSGGDPSGGDPSGGDPSGGDPSGGDPSGGSSGDGDGDGIPDENDGCPGIPEDGNGQSGGDGCPELPDDDDDDDPFVDVETCTQCPCPYADYSSSIWKGDRVRAYLEWEGVIYRYTQPEVINIDVPDTMLGG